MLCGHVLCCAVCGWQQRLFPYVAAGSDSRGCCYYYSVGLCCAGYAWLQQYMWLVVAMCDVRCHFCSVEPMLCVLIVWLRWLSSSWCCLEMQVLIVVVCSCHSVLCHSVQALKQQHRCFNISCVWLQVTGKGPPLQFYLVVCWLLFCAACCSTVTVCFIIVLAWCPVCVLIHVGC